MYWLKKEIKTLIGIDIGARFLKLVEIEQHPDTPILHHYAVIELPISVLNDKQEIKNAATINSALLQLKKTTAFHTQKVAIAMPGSSVVTNEIRLSNISSEHEIEAKVWLEASQHFPDLVEDLSLDFFVNSSTQENMIEVLLVACRKSSIQNMIESLQGSSFQISIVDVDYYALERALSYILKQTPSFNPQQSYALLNLGGQSSTLVVIKDRRLVYTHDLTFEGQHLLQQLQEEEHWPNILLHPLEIEAQKALDDSHWVIENIINHAHYALELFYSSQHESNIEQLFLAGECALLPTLSHLVEAKTGIKTSQANPFVNMSINPHIDTKSLQSLAPLLTLCCGLSLHEGLI